jgi:hypothetical protein
MKKQIINITETDLKNIINESIEKILKENNLEEGFFDNIKSAFKGAKQGYKTQKAVDSNVNTDYSKNTRMSPNEMPSNDAVEKANEYYQIAKDYFVKYNKMKAKANSIVKKYGLKTSGTGMDKTFSYDTSTEYNGNRETASQRHSNYVGKQQAIGNNFKQGIGKWE